MVAMMAAGVRLQPSPTALSHAVVALKGAKAECLLALALSLAALLAVPSRALADGFDEALRVCPDERVTCVSSLDPAHFLEPWELDIPAGRAVGAVERLAAQLGGEVSHDAPSARGVGLHVRWPTDAGARSGRADETVFFFPFDDALVHFRSEALPQDGGGAELWDFARNKRRLEGMRRALHFAKVPVVRSRRAFADERMANGGYRLREERPWLQAEDGPRSLYGEDGAMASDAAEAGPLRMLFPFERLGARGSLAQELLQDARDLSSIGDLRREGAGK
jgi:uncharacterized protein (DUF1499 family)